MIILTGFYNAEEYIERSIASIMGQSFKDFTCYITHDLSTDKSVSLVKEMVKDDSRFTISDVGNCSSPEDEENISVVSYYASLKNDNFGAFMIPFNSYPNWGLFRTIEATS